MWVVGVGGSPPETCRGLMKKLKLRGGGRELARPPDWSAAKPGLELSLWVCKRALSSV